MNLITPNGRKTFMEINMKTQCIHCIAAFSLVFVLAGSSFAAQQEEGEEKLAATEVGTSQERFEYILDNRSDPFIPFLSDKAASVKSVDMNEIVANTQPLTGMQLFEPGQLTLVALLNNGGEDIAMVQDFTGKGYILTEGTLIGRRGVVKNIARNNVIIEETAVTRAGKKIISEVVMILKKEGEE
jgi:hypothetical protein